MQLTGPIFRIALAAAIVTAVAAQTKPSAQRKADAAAKSANHAAQVTYTNGQLSVVANSNSLAETLAEIRNVTKAKIEGVQPGATERISGEFGPDTPRAVVGALLASSHYNFILVSPPGNPGSLQRIVLSEPAPEPIAAAQPVPPQPDPEPKTAPLPQTDEAAKPPVGAELLLEPNRASDAAAKDEPQHRDGVAEKESADTTTAAEPVKETKPDSDAPAPTAEPKSASNDQPTVPATVEICGVKYEASQLENVKVPDHCGKGTQQPNSATASK